jgi:hypothetical protein
MPRSVRSATVNGAASLVDALFWIVSLVLVAAGASKVAAPSATGTTLGALGLPGGDAAARALGVLEVVAGLAALSVGGRPVALAVAVAYAAFAVVVAVARRRELPTCGCFGARSAPPSAVHVAVNAVSAAVAVAAAVAGPVPVADALDGSGATGVVVVGLVLLAAALVIVVDTVVADVVEAAAAVRD